MKAIITAGLCLLLFSSTLRGDSVSLPANLQEVSAGPYIEYLPAPAKSLDVDGIRSGNFNWLASRGDSLSLGYRSPVFWARFSIVNPGTQEKSFFIQQVYSQADRLDLYVIRNNHVSESYNTGDHLTFEQRPVRHRTFLFPLKLAAGEKVSIYMRQANFGSQKAIIRLISPEQLARKTETENAFLWMFYGLMIGMICYNLFLYASIRRMSYIFYVLFLTFLSLFTLSENGLSYQHLFGSNPRLANTFSPVFIALIPFSGLEFMIRFLDLREHSPFFFKTTRTLSLIALGTAALFLLAEFSADLWQPALSGLIERGSAGTTELIRYTLRWLTYLVPVVQFTAFAAAVLLSVRRIRMAYFYLASWLVLLMTGMAYGLMSAGLLPVNFITHWSIYFGVSGQVLVLSLGLADRVNSMRKQLEVFNTQLEEKVVLRTRELQAAMNNTAELNEKLEFSLLEVSNMNEKQNGDYFLTSLLISPLMTNANRSATVKTEINIEQFKKFHFRKHISEIGGDLCITDNIKLGRANYTVFVNGDAMGKSIQGAGGVLVLGASFKAFLAQAKKEANRYTLPELWLRDLYTSLQSLFVSFDGSMYISVVMGLLQEEQGFLYYINSEHPCPVLYRNGRAAFMEEPEFLRKLGTPEEEHKLQINTFRLLPGDQFISGSDGRDDIMLGEEGDNKVNEDQLLFLKYVEEARGDLAGIAEGIKKSARLRDDLSLLKLTYAGAAPPVTAPRETEFRKRAQLLFQEGAYQKLLDEIEEFQPASRFDYLKARAYFAQKRYKRSLSHLRRYLLLHPFDGNARYFTAKVMLKLGHIRESINLLESLVLQNPSVIKYSLALARLLKRQQNTERAKTVARRLLERAPENPGVLELLEQLEPKT